MIKMKEKYCKKCCKETTHNYIGSENEFEELGPIIRGLLAFASLGMTETLGSKKYWQCTKCGKIKKD